MKLLEVFNKVYFDKKIANILENIKDFNYSELDIDEIVDVIKPVIENAHCCYGKLVSVKYTSIDVNDEIHFNNKEYPILELRFMLTTSSKAKIELFVEIGPFGCVYVGLPAGKEIISSDQLKNEISVEFIKFMKGKYKKGYTETCKKFFEFKKSSYIKTMQSNIEELQNQIDEHKRKIKEVEAMYDENNLGLN